MIMKLHKELCLVNHLLKQNPDDRLRNVLRFVKRHAIVSSQLHRWRPVVSHLLWCYLYRLYVLLFAASTNSSSLPSSALLPTSNFSPLSSSETRQSKPYLITARSKMLRKKILCHWYRLSTVFPRHSLLCSHYR